MTERNKALDGLRGIAAVAVIFFHCLGVHLSAPALIDAKDLHDVAARVLLAVFNGETAVFIFFIMSGAVLMNSLQQQKGNFARLAVKFSIERVLRLYPALFAAVIVCYATLLVVGAHPTLAQLLENLVLYDKEINGVTWTLNAEAIATFFILAGFIAFRRFNIAGLLLVLIVVVTASRHAPPKEFLHSFRWSALPFAIGLLIPTPQVRAIATRLPVAALWIAVAGMVFARHIVDSNKTNSTNICICCAGIVVALIFHHNAGWLGQMLSTRLAVFLGTISYSLYLFNVALLIIAQRVIGLDLTLAGCLSLGVLIAAATIPIAWASYWWIEKPAIGYGKQLSL